MGITKIFANFSDWLHVKENTFESPDPLTPDELDRIYREEQAAEEEQLYNFLNKIVHEE